MAGTSRQHQRHEKKCLELLLILPPFVEEYVDDKLGPRSPTTLLNYVLDYKSFFEWLISECLVEAKDIKEIQLSDLDVLSLENAKNFFKHLRRTDIKVTDQETKKPEENSVSRKISSLRSLFKYLTTETEITMEKKLKYPCLKNKDIGEPYFHRNVMQKIPVYKEKSTLNSRAKNISTKILHNEEDIQLLNFVRDDYENRLPENSRKRSFFLRDKERDFSILSLFLSSGIRLNELANLRLRDIFFSTNEIKVIRKGNKEDIVAVFPESMLDLKSYIEIRISRYNGSDNPGDYVFLSKYNGAGSPLSERTIQNIVEKYTKEFFENKKSLSPHKLRHTYGTKYIEETGDLRGLMDQFGHTSTSTTVLYANSQLEKARETAKHLGKRRKT
ncbi:MULTISPECIES: tyrosine recombinase XerS [Paenibacillus]|uniref:tyrosine recombinase XerS n=1 Tax=Paenibacillus TaxID=44249 RepID=UPI0009A6A3E3|nr:MULTISPECIES: tyrosine recombinase XerS [Paenibacillus]MCZ1269221.1 tyrosine recombinase XerS [Paenibacillus tundrae]SLK16173.1 Site-specific recombinase XerC [Paenibacillus sp. RU5A]SOC74234.1 Site-specific recombinase XerC [Paenibacillus sp. RU26A]SOC76384.1 Site-specific recombinase XerC [Paenibacillus sp. RU5M]